MVYFFFNDTATTEIYTLSLHDALPISEPADQGGLVLAGELGELADDLDQRLLHDVRQLDPLAEARAEPGADDHAEIIARSEEHTSELQSRQYLVCRLLLEKKKYLYTQL